MPTVAQHKFSGSHTSLRESSRSPAITIQVSTILNTLRVTAIPLTLQLQIRFDSMRSTKPLCDYLVFESLNLFLSFCTLIHISCMIPLSTLKSDFK
jgi:hypothetical protein